MDCPEEVEVNQPKLFVIRSPAERSATPAEEGEVDLDLYPLVGPSNIFTGVFCSPDSYLE